MRILMSSKREPGRPGRRDGGVQTWIATVAAELRRQGHEVAICGAQDSPADRFDLGIFANALYTVPMAALCRRAVLVCHGIVPDESPDGWPGSVAFTSEEVRNHWRGSGPVIRQPLDLEFWSSGDSDRAGIVRYANRGGLDWLPALAADLGMPCRHVRNATHEQARDALRRAAVVVASGRCAVEAMACGAPVVICDDRPYQGPLLHTGIMMEAMRRNYSGRGGVIPTINAARAAIDHAIRVGTFRWHVEAYHDVRRIAAELLTL